MRKRQLLVLSLALPILLTAGCSPPAQPVAEGGLPSPAVPTTAPTLVREAIAGVATVDGPLVGATVRITALDGTPLGTMPSHADDTHTTGVFTIMGAETPQDFRLIATGGTIKGKPFVGELRAEVRGHTRFYGYIPINPITTIISAYMAAHPDRSLKEATVAVKKFLAIPAHLDVGYDLARRPGVFDGAAYAAAVESQGGHLAYAKALVAELDGGGRHPMGAPVPYRLQQEAAEAEAGEAVATTLAKKLGGAVGDQLASYVFGSAMSALGLGGGNPDAAALAAIQQGIEVIEQKIDDLAGEFQSAKSVELAAITNAAYDTVAAANVDQFVTHNQYHQHTLLNIAGMPTASDDDKAKVKDQIAKLQAYYATVMTDAVLENWNTALVGSSGSDGLIRLWSKKINAASPGFYSYETAMQMQRWWDTMDAAQFDALRIKVLNLNMPTASPSLVADAFALYQRNRKAQVQLLRGMIRTKDVLDLTRIGGPPADTTVLTGSMPGYDAGTWPVTIQKPIPQNGNRILIWRTAPDRSAITAGGGVFPALRYDVNRYNPVIDSWGHADSSGTAAFATFTTQLNIEASAGAMIAGSKWEMATTQLVQSLAVSAGLPVAGGNGPGAVPTSSQPRMSAFGFAVPDGTRFWTNPPPSSGNLEAITYVNLASGETTVEGGNYVVVTPAQNPFTHDETRRCIFPGHDDGLTALAVYRYSDANAGPAPWWY